MLDRTAGNLAAPREPGGLAVWGEPYRVKIAVGLGGPGCAAIA